MANLVTQQEVEAHLKLTPNSKTALITHLLPKASALVERFCERVFASTTYYEVYDGPGGYELMLDNAPIISVSKLSQDIDIEASTYGDLITGAEQLLKKKQGIVELFNETFTKSHKNVYIDYVAGYATTPEDVKLVVLDLIAKKYKDIDDGRFGVTTQQAMGQNITYNFQDLSEFNKKALAAFRLLPPRQEGVAVSQFSAA